MMGMIRYGNKASETKSTPIGSLILPAFKSIANRRASVASTLKKVGNALFADSRIPIIPAQELPKPTVLFDFKDFLVCNKFSLRRFDVVSQRRAFCEEFLYNLVGHYELVGVSDTYPAESSFLVSNLDPFGCITYRIYIKDKGEFTSAHLNRPMERVVVLSTKKDEYSKDFEDNTVHLPRWRGAEEFALLDLVHFFNNLRFLDLKDYRPTIKSYRGHDFIPSFRRVQEWLYNQRNMFSTTNFSAKLANVNERKVNEYVRARQGMNDIRRNEKAVDYCSILNFVKNVIL